MAAGGRGRAYAALMCALYIAKLNVRAPGREPVRDSWRDFAAAATLAGVGVDARREQGAASEGARDSRRMPLPAGWGFALV